MLLVAVTMIVVVDVVTMIVVVDVVTLPDSLTEATAVL